MNAADIMTKNVVTVRPDTSVVEAAKLMAEKDISALPVVDADGTLIGLVSESDLLHREELGTDVRRPWWIEAITPATTLAAEFAKSHGKQVADVMSEEVVTATEDAPLSHVAALLERNRIKRLPIVHEGHVVGIVSRSNLIQALACFSSDADEQSKKSRQIRDQLLARLHEQDWTDFGDRNVIVSGTEVHLWGLVGSEAERKALIAIAKDISGVSNVVDEMIPAY